MSKREVAMNTNWRHGDTLCVTCNTAGRHDVLRPGVCTGCKKATCFACRGGTAEQKAPHTHARFCFALRSQGGQ